jgi:PEP-CTERM motif
MKNQISAILLLSSIFVGNANAAMLTFEDLPGDLTPVGNGYAGFNWNNSAQGISSINKSEVPGTGYDHGAVSGNNTVYNAYGINGNTIDLAGSGMFDFNGAYFTSAFETQNLSFEGWNDGAMLFASENFEINTSTPLLINLNWVGIDRLTINNDGDQWAMDNFTFDAPVSSQVPLPAAFWLLGSGIAGLMGFRRKNSPLPLL